MNLKEICAVLTVFLVHLVRADQKRLSEYVSHYEELNYDANLLHDQHQRVKRSTGSNPYIHLKFQALGRNFDLHLRRDTSTFVENPELEISEGYTVPLDTSHIYEGELWGEPRTYVHGSILDGIFAGTIYTPKENYHIERANVYFDKTNKFHSVIYMEKDMEDDPHRAKREAEVGACGSSNAEVRDWMHQVQNSAIVKDEPEPVVENSIHKLKLNHEELEGAAHNKYLSPDHIRKKRANPTDRSTCTLFLQSDTMLWDRMTKSKAEHGLNHTPDRAREEITSLFATHVAGIKKIYEDTVFKGGTSSRNLNYGGISFVVHRVKINETKRDCPDGASTRYNLFCRPNIDVSNFLNINSLRNHNDFCLAYVFTYRDFTGGTLGLAWVGAPSSAAGGICERWKEYQENSNRVYKSLNTGIVTLINYNSPVPPKVSTLTFAHEVGHNFGSPHDSGSVCTPYTSSGDPAGNYIMYASATSGDRPHNSKFSDCSKSNISLVLDAVFSERYGKQNCFTEREAAFCGNRIVEDDEVCDCGYQEDCNDKCCYGRGHAQQCTLKNNFQCSPSQGPCCSNDCTKIPASDNTECSMKTDCNQASNCDGTSATCPTPAHMRNMTECNEYTQVCINGECRGSVCQVIGWEQCFLSAPEGDKNFDKGTLCYVACQNKTLENAPCVSTGDEEALMLPQNKPLRDYLIKTGKEAIKLPPGAPCNNFRGYCDVFQKCRDVDADGPLSRLKKLLFNEQTFNTIRDWIIKNWWAVLLMGIGLVVFMGIFIQVCAVHTPSSNPKKPPARKISLRPQHHHRQQGPPPPYVGPSRGGPPHGKGRGPAGGRGPQYEMKQRV